MLGNNRKMAEIIQIWEFQAARRRAVRRLDEHQSLKRALSIMRENLAAAASDLRDATVAAQPELLDRIEQLTAMIRYGMRMAGETHNLGDTGQPRPPDAGSTL
jgi:hypothetical protein